jgi:ferritin-like metal-binding protein YciE
MPGQLEDQLVKYLTDAHAIEEQALVQLRRAPANAKDSELAAAFAEHLAETERHEEIVRKRLEAHGAEPSALKDLAMKAGGVGFVLFARAQPDTPGKLTAHAYSYEHLELGAYELLLRIAERAGDTDTAEAARQILIDERRMARRLEACFSRAVSASLAAQGVTDLGESLRRYLADAHAIEAQSVELLKRGPAMAGDPELARLYEEHLAETREQQELVDERLAALGGSPSALKDAALRLGALHWGLFFRSQPDTPGKLAAFAYAFEHLEIAAYEELRRVAERARDEGTAEMARRILAEERAAAAKLAAAVDRAAEASLQAKGVVTAGG